jgi:chromate transporter
LAIVFGVAVIFPNGLPGNIEWFAALMTVISFVAIYKFKIDVLLVVLIGGLIGLIRTFLF